MLYSLFGQQPDAVLEFDCIGSFIFFVPKLRAMCMSKHNYSINALRTGLEAVKLQFILKLKIKHNDWLLAVTCPISRTEARIFLLVDLRDFFFRIRVGGTKKINKKALRMTS